MCELKKGHIIKHIGNSSLIETDNVISSNPRFKDCQARFTSVLVKSLQESMRKLSFLHFKKLTSFMVY